MTSLSEIKQYEKYYNKNKDKLLPKGRIRKKEWYSKNKIEYLTDVKEWQANPYRNPNGEKMLKTEVDYHREEIN